MDNLIGIVIGEIRQGSIIVQYSATFPSGSRTTAIDVDNAITAFRMSAPSAGFTIDPDPSTTFTHGLFLRLVQNSLISKCVAQLQ